MLSTPFKIILLVLFFVFAANAQTATPTPTQPDDTEKVVTEEIKLNVSAVDRDGVFFAGVNKEDLVILEDNRLHQASSLRRIPANVLIVMDTGGELRAKKGFEQTKKTAENLIGALSNDDSIALMQYHDKVEIIAEWTNKNAALNILKTKANFGKRSVFTDALATATKFLQKNPLDNRHLVLITDGTDSFINSDERRAAMRDLLATDINVHVFSYTRLELADIEPRTRGISKVPKIQVMPNEIKATLPNGVRDVAIASASVTINTDRAFLKRMRERQTALLDGEKFLTELSRDTNGEIILPASNEEMLEKTALIARIIDSSYVLTYVPKRALDESPRGEVRNIEVTSRRPNLQVQARRKLVIQ